MEKLFPQEYEKAIDLLTRSHRILLVSHRRPDGDTLGAACAMAMALDQIGKDAVLACIDEIPPRLRFIPWTDRFVRSFEYDDFDCIVIVDAGAFHMTGFHELYPDFLSNRVPIINIDHHASNECFGSVNIVEPPSSSATVVVYKLLKKISLPLTREIALALLAGIYNDTGGLMHSNTTHETFEIVSQLTACGVSVSEVVRPLFKQSTISQLRLWGFILEGLRKNDEGVVSSVVTEEDVRKLDAHGGDTGGIVDLMNTAENAQYTLLLTEDHQWVKGSLRTQRNDVNVSNIAGQFGGGGHPKASGFRVHGRLEKKIVWKIVPK